MNLASFLGIRWENFFQDYFEKDRIPEYYIFPPEIPEMDMAYRDKTHEVPQFRRIAIVNCIPPYLESFTEAVKPGLKSVDKYYRLGYLMDFSNFESPDQYLKNQFRSKKLKEFRRLARKLVTAHSVQFNSYFGNIDRQVYEDLMGCLRSMIEKRFGERAGRHSALQSWEEYRSTGFDMINRSKASLFVYYQGSEPVCIGLSYHRDRVMYAAITSFDQKFEKYGITTLLFIEKIKWCIEHSYKGLDLAWGDLPYKKQLVNEIYRYKTQIIYRESSFLNRAMAQIVGYFLQKKYEFKLRQGGNL